MAKKVESWMDNGGVIHPNKASACEADARVDLQALLYGIESGVAATSDNNEGGVEICVDDIIDWVMKNHVEIAKILTNYQVEISIKE